MVEHKTVESERLPHMSISSAEGDKNKLEIDTCPSSAITDFETSFPVPESSSLQNVVDLSSEKDYTEKKSSKDSEGGKSETVAADSDLMAALMETGDRSHTENVQRSQSKMVQESQIDDSSTSFLKRSTRKRKLSVDEEVSEKKEPPAKRYIVGY